MDDTRQYPGQYRASFGSYDFKAPDQLRPTNVAATTTGAGVTCRDIIQTSYVSPNRRVLFEPTGTASAPTVPITTPQGDAIDTTGLTVSACTPTPTAIAATSGCGASPNRSAGPQLSLAWTGPAALTVTPGAATRDISHFATLEFRTSQNYTSVQQLPTENILPVTLTDTTGATRTVLSSDYSAALEPEPGTSARKQILNGVRIPLAAFTGVNLTSITSIVLGFVTQTTTGSVQFTDLALQESAATLTPALPEAPLTPLLLLGAFAVGGLAWHRGHRHPAPRTT